MYFIGYVVYWEIPLTLGESMIVPTGVNEFNNENDMEKAQYILA